MGLAKALLTPEERYRTRALGYKYKLYGYGFPMAMVVVALLFEIESKNVRMYITFEEHIIMKSN